MTARLLFVGEAPNRIGKKTEPLRGRVGDRLARLAGTSSDVFAARVARTNVLDRWPGPSSKGAAFPLKLARERALELQRRFLRGRVVVLLGKRVASAFDVPTETYFVPHVVRGAIVYVMPHPSGVNRWYNSARNVDACRDFMRSLWHRAGGRPSRQNLARDNDRHRRRGFTR